MRNQSFPGEVSLSSVYRWSTWTFRVSAVMNYPAKPLARSAWLAGLAASPAADIAAGSSVFISQVAEVRSCLAFTSVSSLAASSPSAPHL